MRLVLCLALHAVTSRVLRPIRSRHQLQPFLAENSKHAYSKHVYRVMCVRTSDLY